MNPLSGLNFQIAVILVRAPGPQTCERRVKDSKANKALPRKISRYRNPF